MTVFGLALATKVPVVLKGWVGEEYVKVELTSFTHCPPEIEASSVPVIVTARLLVTVIPSLIMTLPPNVTAPPPAPDMATLFAENGG